jgi:glycosyltransferase involved in cell wall biosynthesis
MQTSVLFLTNAYPDFETSYRGIFIKKMATLLQGEGYKICVVTPKVYKSSEYYEQQDGIKVYRFPFFARNKLLIEHDKIPYLRMVLYYITGFFLTLYAMLTNKCNLIHAHWAIPTGLIGVWVGSLLKKNLIVTIHGSDLRMALERSGFLKRIFIYVCKNASHLNCVSDVQKNEIEQLGISSEKISIVPMGVDEAFLEMGKIRKMELNKRPFTILSNRNLLANYNISLLIRAIPVILKEEPEIRFLIAGDGPERENLEKEANELNIGSTVQFLGRIPHEEMPTLLSQTDIYVSTSLYDGTSVSLLEAMACGTFPIVTDILSNRKWITNAENGFLVPTRNEDILGRKIVEAIRNGELRRQASEMNRKMIEQTAYWKENISKIARIYESSSTPV